MSTETTVREATVEVPDAARAVVVSLDGVMAPMRGAGKYREAGCATVSLVDADGARLHSVRMGRMPESHKTTLKTMVTAEVEAVLAKRPDLTVVKVADGAKDNWTFLTRAVPAGVELIDFYHAVAHLKDAFDTAHGTDSPKAAAQFKKYRHLLRHEPDGVNRVIRALVYLRSKSPGNERIAQVLGYFRGNRHRMSYADAKAKRLPIGSGVVEAACKTLVTERLKRSGMRWGARGGQAILTLRSLVQSQRFDHAWPLLAKSYRTNVACPDNVVPRAIPLSGKGVTGACSAAHFGEHFVSECQAGPRGAAVDPAAGKPAPVAGTRSRQKNGPDVVPLRRANTHQD